MARVGMGSLQQKRGWFYYVVRQPDGRYKWSALHTRDHNQAQARAAEQFGFEALRGDRAAYLERLIEAGERARAELEALRAGRRAESVTWSNLFARWQEAQGDELTAHEPTLEVYRLTVEAMARWAREAGAASPAEVSAELAQSWADAKGKGRVSGPRDLALFLRVWRGAGLQDVWSAAKIARRDRKAASRYRRLTLEEVRRLVKSLRTGRTSERKAGRYTKGSQLVQPDVADLVTLAYHTGMRRGDCQRLAVEHLDGEFLRLVPRKTAGRKAEPILIPLQPEALRIVRARAQAAEQEDRAELFPGLAQAWLTKRISSAMERAGVRDTEAGRASFHSLRATFVSLMDEAGIPPHVTDAITGHARGGMHGRYTQPSRAARMEAVLKAVPQLQA